jgi:hypothetical protein
MSVVNTCGRLPFVDQVLSTKTPTHLYHYTSSDGLIGICSTKTIWASGAAFLNDTKEQLFAFELSQNVLDNRLNTEDKRARLSIEKITLLEAMKKRVYEGHRQIYLVSLTSEPDSLSQWRAYCPNNGGYAIGLPSSHLRSVGKEQGFYLAPCIYKNEGQQRLVNEIIDCHLQAFDRLVANGTDVDTAKDDVVKGFAKDIAEYGPMLKHRSFEQESEWRLVSQPKHMIDKQIGFHTGPHSVVTHYEFKLATSTYPHSAWLEIWRNPSSCVSVPPQTLTLLYWPSKRFFFDTLARDVGIVGLIRHSEVTKRSTSHHIGYNILLQICYNL